MRTDGNDLAEVARVSANTAASTAALVTGAVVAASNDPPPFALVKLVAVARHNAARAAAVWDILSGVMSLLLTLREKRTVRAAVLKLVSLNRSPRVRRYGVSAAADIACDILLLDG